MTVKQQAHRKKLAAIGRLGGLKTKARMLASDPEYFSKLGTLGGQAVKEEYGIAHFSRIGKMSAKTTGFKKWGKSSTQDSQEVKTNG